MCGIAVCQTSFQQQTSRFLDEEGFRHLMELYGARLPRDSAFQKDQFLVRSAKQG